MVKKCLEYGREPDRHHRRYLPLPLPWGRRAEGIKSGKACSSFFSLQNRGGVYSSGWWKDHYPPGKLGARQIPKCGETEIKGKEQWNLLQIFLLKLWTESKKWVSLADVLCLSSLLLGSRHFTLVFSFLLGEFKTHSVFTEEDQKNQ